MRRSDIRVARPTRAARGRHVARPLYAGARAHEMSQQTAPVGAGPAGPPYPGRAPGEAAQGSAPSSIHCPIISISSSVIGLPSGIFTPEPPTAAWVLFSLCHR